MRRFAPVRRAGRERINGHRLIRFFKRGNSGKRWLNRASASFDKSSYAALMAFAAGWLAKLADSNGRKETCRWPTSLRRGEAADAVVKRAAMRDRFALSGFRLRDQPGDIGLRSNDVGDRIGKAALREPNKVFAFLHSAIEHTTRDAQRFDLALDLRLFRLTSFRGRLKFRDAGVAPHSSRDEGRRDIGRRVVGPLSQLRESRLCAPNAIARLVRCVARSP